MYVLLYTGTLPPSEYSTAQILFISGLTLIIGPQKTFYFFARKQKIRGTVCFLGGVLLVFLKWPFVGVVVETFGFLNLFGCVNFTRRQRAAGVLTFLRGAQ